MGVALLQFQRFSHGGVQADMVLATSWLAGNRKLTDTLCSILSIGNLKTCPDSDTLSLTRPDPLNKAVLPSSAAPNEIMGVNYIQALSLSLISTVIKNSARKTEFILVYRAIGIRVRHGQGGRLEQGAEGSYIQTQT